MDELTGEQLAAVLQELKVTLLRQVLRTLGQDRTAAILTATLQCEAAGGIITGEKLVQNHRLKTMPGRREDAVVQRRLVSKKGAKRVLGVSFSVHLPR